MKNTQFSESLKTLLGLMAAKKKIDKSEEELLSELQSEILRLLEKAHETPASKMKNNLIKQLDGAIEQFEKTHPQLTSNMEKVIDMLNQMGI